MKRHGRALAGAVLLALGLGCAGPQEPVVIVCVYFEEQAGAPDWHTVVEFPDKTRRSRYGKWGEVGDKFTARKAPGGGWE